MAADLRYGPSQKERAEVMRTPKERIAQGIEKAVENGRDATPATMTNGATGMRFGRRATDPPVIPSTSALHAMQGIGRLGQCFGCGRPAASHLGHKGEFKGCPNVLLPPNSTFALVPLVATAAGGMELAPTIAEETSTLLTTNRRATDIPADGTPVQAQRAAKSEVHANGTRVAASPFKVTRFVYAPVDRRKVLKGELATPAMVDAYSALLKSKKALTATEAAKKAKRPQEANRRCLNLLVENGLVAKSALE
jgi:hypothetical protein